MKAECARLAQVYDAALVQIGFRQRAPDRSTYGKQPSCGLCRARRCRCACPRLRWRPHQPEKTSRLVQEIAPLQALHRRNQIEQVAVRAVGGIGLMCS